MNFRHLFPLLVVMCSGIASWNSVSGTEIEMRFGEVYLERESGPLKADIYLPPGKGPFPGVLVVHGGAWRIGHRAQLSAQSQMLARNGFTAVAISYRLAPEFKFPAQIEDCKAAVRWMRSQAESLKIDPNRIGGFGYSAGAQLVSLLGTSDEEDGLEGESTGPKLSTRLQAVACGGAPCEFRVLPEDNYWLSFWLGGSRGEVPEQYRLASPAAFVSADDPPMFFFHGKTDTLVPIDSPQLMVRQLTEAGVESDLYVVPDTGHIFAVMDREALTRSLAFLNRHLRQEPRQ